jgi:DNA-binding GntR family transcriptional regulator
MSTFSRHHCEEYEVTQPVPQEQLSRDGTFSRQTEAVLRDMILDGSIRSGERLNEVALANALGISRGPLREAVQRLVGEGLLTVVSHRGSFVRTFERREVEELYDLRFALELAVVRLVTERATDQQVSDLLAMLEATAEQLSSDTGAAYPADRDLHSQLIVLSDHPTIAKATIAVQRQISLARSMSAKGPVRARQALDEHRAVATAIAERDADKAASLMRLHLEEARTSAVSALGLGPDQEAKTKKVTKP